jgi:antagonist of KipI
MGTRLVCPEGPPVHVHAGRGELISFGVVQGAIQLPPGGNPLVLNVDHQTTGGYPLAGVVIEADQSLMAQLAPGQTVRFDEVSVGEARAVYAQKYADFAKALRLLRAGQGVGFKI